MTELNQITGYLMSILGVIFAVGIIGYYGFSGEDAFMEYEYTTATNTTDSAFSSTANGTIILYGLDISRLIDDEDDGTYLALTIANSNTSAANITAYLGTDSLGVQVANASTSMVLTYSDLQDYLSDGTQTFTLVSDTDNVAINNTALYYNSDTYDDALSPMVNFAILAIIVVIMSGIAFKKI